MLPWGVRNYVVLDSFTLLSTEGGHVFWLGNNPLYDTFEHREFSTNAGYTAMLPPSDELSASLKGKSEAEASRIFARAAWQHIAAHPGAFLVRAARKTWNMWRPTFSGGSRRNRLVSWTLYPVLLAACLSGIVLAVRTATSGRRATDITGPVGLLCGCLLIQLGIHA